MAESECPRAEGLRARLFVTKRDEAEDEALGTGAKLS